MAEASNVSTPKLPLLLSTPPVMKLKYSPDQHSSSGVLTPPLHTTLASIPFKWEEIPGKPRVYCTDLTIFNDQPKCLEPPPGLYYLDKNTKIPSSSPITVLNGPYNVERGQLGTLVLYKKNKSNNKRRGYWWQRFVKRRNRKESGVGGGNFVISSTSPIVKMDRHGRSGCHSHARPHIWKSIYEGFKQVIPWKGKTSKK